MSCPCGCGQRTNKCFPLRCARAKVEGKSGKLCNEINGR
jgi:hypothetical protein